MMNTYLEIISNQKIKTIAYVNITFKDDQMILNFQRGLTHNEKLKINLNEIIYVAKTSLIGGNTFTFNYRDDRITIYEDGLAITNFLENHFKYCMVEI
jgi:hypothetical protein